MKLLVLLNVVSERVNILALTFHFVRPSLHYGSMVRHFISVDAAPPYFISCASYECVQESPFLY